MPKIKKSNILLLMVFFTLTATALPCKYIFRCYLEEGTGELSKFTCYKYEKIGSYPIYTGSIAGPKKSEGDFRTPWGKYELGNIFSYKDEPAALIKYPNAYDKSVGATGGRILVHCGKSSVGCVSVQDTAFLREKLPLLVKDGEIHIFPSRMTPEKVLIWKKLLPDEVSLIDQLETLYQSIDGCEPAEKNIFSVNINLDHDCEVFGFEKNQYDLVAGNMETMIDYLRDFISLDSVIWNHTSDQENQVTRFSWSSTGFKSNWIPFDKIQLSLNGTIFSSLVKTKDGCVLNVTTGIPEGILLLKEISEMKQKKIVSGNPVVVYIGERRYVSSPDHMPFQFSSPVKYNQGIIIPEKRLDVRIVSISGEIKLSRAAGEDGFFVRN